MKPRKTAQLVPSHTENLNKTTQRRQTMSRLVWKYQGAVNEKHGEQCVLVGDTVVDDVFGEGKAVRMDGTMLVVEFLEDGEPVEKPRTKGHLLAKEQRDRAQQPRTGRRPGSQRGLMEMLGDPAKRRLLAQSKQRSDIGAAHLVRSPRQQQSRRQQARRKRRRRTAFPTPPQLGQIRGPPATPN